MKKMGELSDHKAVGTDGFTALGHKAYEMAAEIGEFLAGGGDYQTKSPLSQFDDTRTLATFTKSKNDRVHMLGDVSVTEHMMGPGSAAMDMPTDRSKVISGIWFKWLIHKQCKTTGRQVPRQFQMKGWELKAVAEISRECKFVGPIGYDDEGARNYSDGGKDTDKADFWCEGEKVYNDLQLKALLDDSTSGGLEAVPIEFDAALILTPILTGELFPLVSITNVTRRRIEAASMSNPTVYWGSSEGSAINLFDTDGFISAFDNSIFPVTGAMELGRDFMSDSPLDIGGVVQNRYGQVFRAEMDDVIATGDGTTQPEGIFTASGVTTINAAGGAGAAPQVGDYESLYFDVGKAFRQEAGNRFVYVGTDTSYKRARGIPVDSSNDARRIFGLNQKDYTVFDNRYRVNSTVGNANIAGVAMNRYRMYRRQGLEVRIVNDDRESVRRNTELVVVRARFGGALDHSSAMVKMTDAQA